ncbi:tetratricopeptide repeat protein [Lacinutrix sp. WUR7]|uniref:tetratricopeptide repeat-containing sensor histidine kinase n=1 Tax=Lacinutrix sp. WUR7 TaxID=2653681 RepID=UPI00193E9C04|nr:tetratricopeptide repeat protein [Lacinutrix sp. WUR7]
MDSTLYYANKISESKSSDALKKAYQFFKKDMATSLRIGRKDRVVSDLLYISRIEFKTGFYNESESSSVKALSILNELEESDYNKGVRKVLYNHLGQIYKEKKIYSEAIKMYNEALVLTEKSIDSLVIYNNISNILKSQKQFKEAEKLLLQAVEMFDQVKDTLERARVLDNLGLIQLKLGKKEESLSYLMQALSLKTKTKSNSSLYASYKNLALYFSSEKDSVKAHNYALKAYNLATVINSISYKLDAGKRLIELGDYSEAKKFVYLNDSLNTLTKLSENKYALLKYDVSNMELKSQKEKTKKQQYRFIALIIFLLGTFLFFVLKAQHKKDKVLQVYKTETRISKKVHDEVANDIYQVMTKLQGKMDINEDVLDDLEDIYDKTRDISKESSAVNMEENFEDGITDLLLSYKSNTVNVLTKGIATIEWQSLSAIKKIAIYRVLQELMTNMKKHSQASIVVLVFKNVNNKISINYKDNGVGCTLKKYNGLQNTENRMETINGTITFDSSTNNGFKVNLII